MSAAPTLVFPQGLLTGVTTLQLAVYDPQGTTLSCDAMNGTVAGLTNQVPLASTNLNNTGCAGGAAFCGQITVDKTSDMRLFTAQAFQGNSTSPVASGCTAIAPNQDTIQVTITMLRTLPPQQCNGATATELVQCTTGSVGDLVCDQNCQSIEELYSTSDGTTTSVTADHVRPMLTWPAASGDPGRLVGVWGEKRTAATEVSMRVLGDDMEPTTTGSSCVQTNSFRVPTSSATPCPGQSYALSQFNPTVTSANGNYQIAYEDTSAGPTAIMLVQLNANLAPSAAPVNLSSGCTACSGVAQSAPYMALSGGNLFVAWDNNGSVVGRTVTLSTMALGTVQTLSTGSSNSGVVVAGTSSGWVATYLNGGDVDMVTLDGTNPPSSPTKVNASSGITHPGVATSGSTTAVIWADGRGHILVQRYVSGTEVQGDQNNAIEDPSLNGNQKEPSIAGGTNFFVATWVDGGTGDVRARFLDTNNGYMFNLVNGQSTDFKASGINGDQRDNPIAVAGGSGPFIAIAWEDNTGAPASFKGIWGRRFPLPE